MAREGSCSVKSDRPSGASVNEGDAPDVRGIEPAIGLERVAKCGERGRVADGAVGHDQRNCLLPLGEHRFGQIGLGRIDRNRGRSAWNETSADRQVLLRRQDRRRRERARWEELEDW